MIFEDSRSGTASFFKRMKSSDFRFIASGVLYVLGTAVLSLVHLKGESNFPHFIALFIMHLLLTPPARTISPLSVLYGYYGLWFILAPAFAGRYEDAVFATPEYTLAIVMAYMVFGIGLFSIRLGEFLASKVKVSSERQFSTSNELIGRLKTWMLFLYVTATASVALIVTSTGGIETWVNDPGDAFLNRGGSGAYVILSHFSALALAALSGYVAHTTQKKFPLLFFLLWLVVTAPVHGSKLQIALFGIVLFMPWLRELRPYSARSYLVYALFAFVFFLGMYFRSANSMDVLTLMLSSLNYFTALENLALSLRDFSPGLLTTFHLPFFKFTTPFGLSDPNLYYDMNHLLTDYYFPEKWEIRATEQWPVETDLYLNFFFVGGLPVVALYFLAIGFFHGRSLRTNTLGWLFTSTLMTVWMISHLRGSLINHTDFYLYPYAFLMLYLLRNLRLQEPKNRSPHASQ